MPRKLEEITGVYRHEIFHRGDFLIGEADSPAKPFKFKGTIDDNDELTLGMEYSFFGHWESTPRYGQTFNVKTYTVAKPHTRSGIIAYLVKYAPGVGHATALALWNKFKGDAVRILRESPDVAAAALNNRFNLKKAEKAAVELEKRAALEDCEIKLVGLLDGRGFPKGTSKLLVQSKGNKAAKLIEHNPYLLMAHPGCGFLRTDAMYLDLGHNPARIKRQALAAWHAIASNMDGHTWHPVQTAVDGIRAKVGGAAVQPVKAVKLAKRSGMLAVRRDENDGLWLAEGAKAKAEGLVAKKVAAMMRESSKWGDVLQNCEPACFNRLSPHQRWVLQEAVTGQSTIGILGGGPGTGKTFTASTIAESITSTYGHGDIALACPTGKAAVRLTEAMQSYNVDLQATTIHRLLKVESAKDGSWSFVHGEYEPLPYKFIILDEASMLGTGLMASLLLACAKGTHLLFIGDCGQLSPVEHGAPLRDFVAAGVPYGELTEVQRNAGTIVHACHHIRAGRPPKPDDHLDVDAKPPRNLQLLRTQNGEASADRIVQAICKIRDLELVDPIWDVQVIVAVNKKSPLSVQQLNRKLQAELNPNGGMRGSPFRLHDKVIQTKNSFLLAANPEDGDEDARFLVCNGEQGKVVEVREKITYVEFSNPQRLVKIPRGTNGDDNGDDDDTGTGCDLQLAYACTVHKSQGSEWPVVFVALDDYPGARMVASREWIYTAISRAKKACYLVGKQTTADGCTRRVALQKRKTFLVERIDEQLTALGPPLPQGPSVELPNNQTSKEVAHAVS